MQPRILWRPYQTPIRSSRLFQRNALTRRRYDAFTLIELLVVIAIIAILIGLLFPAFRAVQNQAKQTQAKNDLTQIVNAVNAYYTDYGKYPVDVPTGNTSDAYFGPGSAPPGATSYGSNDWLFDVIRANTSSTKMSSNACPGINLVTCLNGRQIVFINPPYAKDPMNPRSGIGTPTGIGPSQFFDPWGTPYKIEIDENYANQITNPYTFDTGAGPATLTQGVIAWSLGRDTTQGTNFSASDDVISWQ